MVSDLLNNEVGTLDTCSGPDPEQMSGGGWAKMLLQHTYDINYTVYSIYDQWYGVVILLWEEGCPSGLICPCNYCTAEYLSTIVRFF